MANYNALLTCLSNAAPAGSNDAVQYNGGGGTFGSVGPMTNGQLIIGSISAAPQAQTLTAGSAAAALWCPPRPDPVAGYTVL